MMSPTPSARARLIAGVLDRLAKYGVETTRAVGAGLPCRLGRVGASRPFEATEEASFQRLTGSTMIFAKLGYPDLPEAFFHDIGLGVPQRSAFFVFPDVDPCARRDAGRRPAPGGREQLGCARAELLQMLELGPPTSR